MQHSSCMTCEVCNTGLKACTGTWSAGPQWLKKFHSKLLRFSACLRSRQADAEWKSGSTIIRFDKVECQGVRFSAKQMVFRRRTLSRRRSKPLVCEADVRFSTTPLLQFSASPLFRFSTLWIRVWGLAKLKVAAMWARACSKQLIPYLVGLNIISLKPATSQRSGRAACQ
jgi:hypothetical protein